MPKLRVHNLSMSLDGYVAGPDQSLEDPLGVNGERLHEWIFPTGAARDSIDDDFVTAGNEGIGATVMGRNMFGPVRGPWPDDSWTGWWDADPPFHHPVFVLTHHRRPPVTMEGGTTFHFVPDGIAAALDLAFGAADGQDVRLGGGASTVHQYLRAGLVDEMHIAIVPVLLGGGERLFDDVGDLHEYGNVEFIGSESVLHVRVSRTAPR